MRRNLMLRIPSKNARDQKSKNDKFEEVASLMRLPKEFDLNVVSTSTAAGN